MRPYLRAGNVTWNGLDLSDVKQMNFDPVEAERFALEPGDILLAEASGSALEVGRPVLWQGEITGACFQTPSYEYRRRVHCRNTSCTTFATSPPLVSSPSSHGV